MTWAKFGIEFPEEMMLAGVSDAAFRTHAEAICWLYRTEQANEHVRLVIPKRLLPKIVGTPACDTAAEELRDAGLWRETAAGWVIEHHADVIRQSIAAQRAKREGDRQRQRRKRKADISADVGTDVTRDVAATHTSRQSRPANHLAVPASKPDPQRKRERAK